MEARLRKARDTALAAIEKASNAQELEELRTSYLGRKGVLRQVTANLPSLAPEERPRIGKLANEIKNEIVAAIETARQRIARPQVARTAARFDVTLPGNPPAHGSVHPLTQTIMRIRDIFRGLGFEVASGPEVELEYYNFEALNIPLDHPARDAFDTFYLHDDVLLRSQTSTVQIRVMEKRRPPLRIIAPGKCYRPDTVDASHMFTFHQIEGLMVDEGVAFADLKYALHEFARAFFGPHVGMRFRPSFFPFTEPSAEIDVSCIFCGGDGCSVCSRTGWLEVLGCGMVDPNVFECVGYDAERYTGFAFGMGVERLAMLKHRIGDIRLFTENDVRFLRQFRGTP